MINLTMSAEDFKRLKDFFKDNSNPVFSPFKTAFASIRIIGTNEIDTLQFVELFKAIFNKMLLGKSPRDIKTMDEFEEMILLNMKNTSNMRIMYFSFKKMAILYKKWESHCIQGNK